MRSNFFWTANRMITAWVVVMLAVVSALVIGAEAAGVSSIVVFAVVSLVGPLSLLLPLMRTLTRQIDRVVEHTSSQRPGSTVIPAAALTWTRAAGDALGLQTAGRNASGGSPAALIVLADRVELWSGRDEPEPRWSAPREDLAVLVDQVRVGWANIWDVVDLSDGQQHVLLSPRYSPLPNEAGKDIDRVLTALGLDPARVRRPTQTPAVSRKTVRLVRPFYLKLSGAGVTEMPDGLRRDLVRASRKVTSPQVRDLLAGDWRQKVVGAWLALAVPADEVREAVLDAMAQAQSDRPALPLAAVSALLAGPAAIEAMDAYLERAADQSRPDDSFEIVTAAVAHLGQSPVQAPPAWAVEAFEEMMAAAADLQQAFGAVRA